MQGLLLLSSLYLLVNAANVSLYDALFPLNYTYSSGFTAAVVDSYKGVERVNLSATDLNIIHIKRKIPPADVQYANKTTWHAFYPKGVYSGPGSPNISQGMSFYVNGSDEFTAACAAGAKEVITSYSVYFEKDFEFQEGGKLPGGCACQLLLLFISSTNTYVLHLT